MNIDFEKSDGLVPAIIQDAYTKDVLMLGYMNKEAYEKTISTGLVTFYSRSRKCLWTKGETSKHYLHLVDIKADCDSDTLLVRVHPDGPTCHKGTDTCWGEKNESSPLLFLSELSDFIEKRYKEMPEGSYTTSLFKDGLNRMYEGSDMLYHLIVLLTSKGLRIEEMAAELRERHNPGWKKH